LAAPKAGRERGGTEVPAHRAGGRYQVRGPGLRWSLARIHLAVAAIAIVALLLPAWAMIGVNARDRAVAAAQLRAAAAAAVLAVSTDPATVDEALRDVLGDGAERVAVHGLAAPVGAGRATEDQLRTVSPPSTEDDQTVVVPVPEGVVHLRGGPRPARPAGALVAGSWPAADFAQAVPGRPGLRAGTFPRA